MKRKAYLDRGAWSAYLHDTLQAHDFQSVITQVRRKYMMPITGYRPLDDSELLDGCDPSNKTPVPHPGWLDAWTRYSAIKLREELVAQNSAEHDILLAELKNEYQCTLGLYWDTASICARFGLFFPLRNNPILFYVFYNMLPPGEDPWLVEREYGDGFTLSAAFIEQPSLLVEALINEADQEEKLYMLEQQRFKEMVYPISIRSSALCAVNQLKAYLSRHWKQVVAPELGKTREELGIRSIPKWRKQEAALVQRFITSNLDKSPNEIRKQLKDVLGVLKTTSEVQSIIWKKALKKDKKRSKKVVSHREITK